MKPARPTWKTFRTCRCGCGHFGRRAQSSAVLKQKISDLRRITSQSVMSPHPTQPYKHSLWDFFFNKHSLWIKRKAVLERSRIQQHHSAEELED